MAETSIEWTDTTPLRARATAAKRIGVTLQEYDRRRAAGEKWCTACKAWHLRAAFGVDSSRTDGLSSKCTESRVVATRGPGARERRIKKALGLAWCRRCRAWLPAAGVAIGLCRPHTNEAYREYYAANAGVISRRHTARKRKLDPVPEWWFQETFAAFGGKCAYGCGCPAKALDHIYPVARGGRSRPENLVPACSCVEVQRLPDGRVVMRNSADPDGLSLVFTPAEWEAFKAGVCDGEFDVDKLEADRV